jgi:hypothetical protein
LINGVPDSRFLPLELRIDSRLDQRIGTVLLKLVEDNTIFDNKLASVSATLAVPLRLSDNQHRWKVLTHGRLINTQRKYSPRTRYVDLQINDLWSERLNESPTQFVWQTADGGLINDDQPTIFGVGSKSNRSNKVWSIDGQLIYVLQENGQPWTVFTALATLNVLGNLKLNLLHIPKNIQESSLHTNIDLGDSIGLILGKILEPYSLVIERDLTREAGVVVERRSVRASKYGRQVTLAWKDQYCPLGDVIETMSKQPIQNAEQWIAKADGWTIESTFNLVKGWDPSLENGGDTQYSKLNNPDFPAFANVFRLWVLNEDGAFSIPPYIQGNPFDLTAFFGDGFVRPRPIRFESCLTLDDSGTRRSPIVEASLDAGVNWSTYTGTFDIRNDRAAVYLDDSTLSPSFLSAAKAGTVRVRITASLQNPASVQITRWKGNPFSGNAVTRELDVADSFQFAKVSNASIHYNNIKNGSLVALTADDTYRLSNWLINQMQLASWSNQKHSSQARLHLSGSWPFLRVGDRIINTAGNTMDAEGHTEAISTLIASVLSLSCKWREPTHEIHRGSKESFRAAPSTSIDLII